MVEATLNKSKRLLYQKLYRSPLGFRKRVNFSSEAHAQKNNKETGQQETTGQAIECG